MGARSVHRSYRRAGGLARERTCDRLLADMVHVPTVGRWRSGERNDRCIGRAPGRRPRGAPGADGQCRGPPRIDGRGIGRWPGDRRGAGVRAEQRGDPDPLGTARRLQGAPAWAWVPCCAANRVCAPRTSVSRWGCVAAWSASPSADGWAGSGQRSR